jgi:hypothetical protein
MFGLRDNLKGHSVLEGAMTVQAHTREKKYELRSWKGLVEKRECLNKNQLYVHNLQIE